MASNGKAVTGTAVMARSANEKKNSGKIAKSGRMLVRRNVLLSLKLCKFKIPGRLLRSNPIVIPSLNSSAYSAEVPCL